MGELLGLKKTDRYWLVHKKFLRRKILPERCGSILRTLKSGMQTRSNTIKSPRRTGKRIEEWSYSVPEGGIALFTGEDDEVKNSEKIV